MTQVFLSYRRDDAADAAGRIHDRLIAKYGSDRVFMDVDTIPPGIDFRGVIDEAVGRCQLFLVIIGPSWLTVVDRAGRVRLKNPADFVRLEIEAALRRDIPVIPVLVGGAEVPSHDQLPDVLHPLVFRNALPVRRNPDFHHDVDRLMGWMEKLLEKKPAAETRSTRNTPPPTETDEAARIKREAAEAAFRQGQAHYNGFGVPQDYAPAARYFRFAADLGHAAAQFNLGWLYRNGWGVPQDFAEAIRWYRLAADQNHADALRNIGLTYQYGWGVPPDPTEAMRWYLVAADHNLAAAQNNIAVLYEKGEGVPVDLVQALAWYRTAAANGHKKANDAVRRLAVRVAALLAPRAPSDK